MKEILKKLILISMAAALVVAAAGCGKADEPKDEVKTETAAPQEDKQEEAAEEPEVPTEEPEAPAEEPETAAEAPAEEPLVESAEELESMVNEFNETEDPERKEELRKELEAILSQAEAMAQE